MNRFNRELAKQGGKYLTANGSRWAWRFGGVKPVHPVDGYVAIGFGPEHRGIKLLARVAFHRQRAMTAGADTFARATNVAAAKDLLRQSAADRVERIVSELRAAA